jgi:UDP-N-acetylmuramoyl-L-alanyl-D-glutamate--2,6-diaminopimelate ligase
MTLSKLLHDVLGIKLTSKKKVKGIAQDNRKVSKGFIFVARRGDSVDGHIFVDDAIRRGAIAVVGEKQGLSEIGIKPVPYIHVENAKHAVAKLASTFYKHPSQALFTLGVTGTDGKTTTSFLLHHLLGTTYTTGLLSTAGIRIGEKKHNLEGHFTTPEAPEVQSFLATFRDEGCTHAVIESSSHGFAQHRLDDVHYDVGIWTNLSPEHLDFHKTIEAYREAKAELMRRARVSILNRDDAQFEYFYKEAKKSTVSSKLSPKLRTQESEENLLSSTSHLLPSKIITYGRHPESNWRLLNIDNRSGEQVFQVKMQGIHEQSLNGNVIVALRLPMVGEYNVYNALAALAAAYEAGVMLDDLFKRLETFPGVPGRMQVVQREPFAVIVDFAHTPPALEKVLSVMRPVTEGRLIVVVGAAGERDPGKRQPLGSVAIQNADLAIFTEEDSRSEDINQILAEMSLGAIKAGGEATKHYWCIPDRSEAIKFAVVTARPGDTVLLVGKGHEYTLERADETISWDEVAEAHRALERRF